MLQSNSKSPQSVSASSVSTGAGETAPVAKTLPAEPHPDPNPTTKEFQKQALSEWENEGGQGPDYGVTYEQICLRAYEIYQASGCIDGRCEENWHQAERELREKLNAGRHPDKATATTKTAPTSACQ